jgi:LacI family transcriptional regulator
MATIKDVAKLAGVSTATVSAAINGTAFVSPRLKTRVDEAIAELGYATDGIARSLKKGKSSLIGLIVDDVTSPFYAELVEEIESLAHRNGYTVLLCHTGRDVKKERDYLRLLRSHRVDGIVWAPTGGALDYPESSLKQFTVPLVFVDRVVPTFANYDSVLLNNRAAGVKAANYLLDLGHRHVAMISGPDFLEPARERTQGFRDAFRQRRLPVPEDLIVNGNFREAQAFEESRKLLEGRDPVTAVLVANNPMFIGVMRAISLVGRSCPQDISVVSVDDFPLADALRPHITAVRQPVREMAQAALRLVLQRIAGVPAAAPTHLLFEPLLIVRDSCAPYQVGQTAA